MGGSDVSDDVDDDHGEDESGERSPSECVDLHVDVPPVRVGYRRSPSATPLRVLACGAGESGFRPIQRDDDVAVGGSTPLRLDYLILASDPVSPAGGGESVEEVSPAFPHVLAPTVGAL